MVALAHAALCGERFVFCFLKLVTTTVPLVLFMQTSLFSGDCDDGRYTLLPLSFSFRCHVFKYKVGISLLPNAQLFLLQVLFPLLEQVKAMSTSAANVPPPSDTLTKGKILIHHSRDTAEKQWAETRVLTLNGVSRVFNTRRQTLANLEEFPRAWALLLEFIESAALSNSAEVVLAALKSFQEIVQDENAENSLNESSSNGNSKANENEKTSKSENSKSNKKLKVKPKFYNESEADLNLWTNALRVWYNIGTTSMSSSYVMRAKRDVNGKTVIIRVYPAQAYLTALVQVFPSLFRRIYVRFGLADLQKLSSILDASINVPVPTESSPFLVPSFQDTVLTSLQHAILDVIEILQEPIPSATGCVLDIAKQPMYPTLFSLLLQFTSYACVPPKVPDDPDKREANAAKKKEWTILSQTPFAEKCLRLVVEMFQKCASKSSVMQEKVMEKIVVVSYKIFNSL